MMATTDQNKKIGKLSRSPIGGVVRKREYKDEKRPHDKSEAQPFKRRRTLNNPPVDQELGEGVNLDYGSRQPQYLADYLSKQTARFHKHASSIELDELSIPASPIIDTTTWVHHRTTDKFPDFLRYFAASEIPTSNLSGASGHGCPHTLVVAMSGIRAAELARAARVFQTKHATVSKLFAKHIKLTDAIKTVRKTSMSIGVGTPTRICDLLRSGALKVTNLTCVVIDASHIDAKKRGILEMKDTQLPLMKLLCREDFRQRYQARNQCLKLLFF